MSYAGEPRLIEVAGDVYAYEQPDGGWCLNNAGFVVGEHTVTVIDTAATQARAEALRAAIASVTPAVPDTIVNTHFHGDHVFGNFVFGPQATVLAHRRTRDEVLASGLALQGLWPGVEWGRIELRAPTVALSGEIGLHVDDLELRVEHLGPAHTVSDSVVWLPHSRVLFAGDLVFAGGTPFVLMGSVQGSLEALERLRALDPVTVVPGHGPVSGPEVLETNAAYLRWLQGLAKEGVAAGLTPLELARSAGPGPFGELNEAERLVANLHRAYGEERGLAPGSPLDVVAIFHQLVEYHGRLPECHA
ncbi:MBL fold metallo-hydrolase [Nonomuraea typhae]|uniref:MBL fold metallo-hydrolase n=1 Tax=Nonomuraea typhae TaxID=2603600 RepID=A0ABW7YQ09_9ACTN